MTTQQPTILELCSQIETEFHLAIERLPSDPDEYILEVIGTLAWLARREKKRADDYADTVRMQSERIATQADRFKDAEKSLRGMLEDNNDTRQMQLNRAVELLTLIVEESMTHGQKNGAILLVIATLRKMSQNDLYLGDIPF